MYGTVPYTKTMAITAKTRRIEIRLNEAEAERFLDALEHPERFEAGLAHLARRPSVIPGS
jgi:uncharacterized protein (DUF1778 family)